MTLPRTYRAVLRDGRIEWLDPPPRRDQPIPVHILIPNEETGNEEGRGKTMAAALKRLADRGGISAIKDPVEWQRGLREDRHLPGRDH